MKRVQRLPENMYLNNIYWCQIDLKHFQLFGRTPPFLLWKTALKSKIWEFILTLLDTFEATLIERRATISRKYLAKQGIVLPNWLKIFQRFWWHPPFLFTKKLKIQFFRDFLSLIDPLLATFSETRAHTSRKYVAKQGIVMPNWSKRFPTFRWHCFVFALEKQPKNLNLNTFLPLNRPFVGYFQWNVCTYFQRICS